MPEQTVEARPNGRGELRLAGALAALLALGVLWLSAIIWPSIAFAPGALANRLIRLAPGGISTFFIEALGHWAKRLLGAGVLIGALAVGGEVLAGTAQIDRPRPVRAGLILVLLSAAATLSDPAGDANIAAVVAVNAIALLVYASAAGRWHSMLTSGAEPDRTRRRVLAAGLGGAAALALGGGALGWLARRLGGPNTAVDLRVPAVAATIPDRPGFPAIEGHSPEVTSAEDHYVVDINIFKPAVEADGWRLRVTGLVDEPLELSFNDLQARFEVVEEFAVLTCISNEVGGDLIGHSRWGGVRLADVLDSAGVKADAVDVVLRAADGYADSISLEVARRPDVLLAVSQNGEPLTQEHGFPCRLRVPPIYGMKNVKWLREIELVDRDFRGYWQEGDGWSDTAVVKTQSRIDAAGADRTARLGEETWIAGVAWAGDRGISKVEVSTDGGKSWEEADLRQPVGDLSWRQWAYRWTPAREGDAVVVVRATDGTGEVQTDRGASPHPAGATGYHMVTVDVG